jgi:uncharacterized protein
LLDLNVLIALTEQAHSHHQIARRWFTATGRQAWGICPLTEAGFIRVTTNPAYRPVPRSMGQAIAILQTLKGYPEYWYLEMSKSWVDLTAPFATRIYGHQQVTDAFLLGLAIEANAVLVTFDRAIASMAGGEFATNVRVLQ